MTWNVTYSDAVDMPPIQSLGGAKWAQEMERKDPEKYKHVAGVYPPWTAKPWMVREAKNFNPYHSKYFFWVDAGGFRDGSWSLEGIYQYGFRKIKHHFRALPQKLEKLYESLPDDTVLLGDANRVWPEGQAGVKYAKAASTFAPDVQKSRADRYFSG